MRVYSKELNLFTKKSELIIKEILSKECGIGVRKTRFAYNSYLYPIKVITYQDQRINQKSILAYFDSNFFSIKINKTLSQHLPTKDFKNLLRHEIAHYLCYLDFGNSIESHGKEYINKCKSFNWNDDVYKAHYPFNLINEDEKNRENLNEKYQKLMNLGNNTTNAHEASLALKKASEMVLKYGEFQSTNHELYYVDDLITFKKKTSKLMAIYHILEQMHFGVCFHYGNNQHALETYGLKTSVIQAKAIFKFLNSTLDSIWKAEKTKFQNMNKSLITYRNSYFNGFAEGVCVQLKHNEKTYNHELQNALILFKREVARAKDMIYGRFSYSKRSSQTDQTAKNSGFKKGLKFNLNFQKHKYLQR